MHECIGLAIVAHEEAKAFHRVEELYRPGRLFAGQLALGRAACGRRCDHFADNLQVLRRNLPAAIDEVEFELLPFGKAFQTGTLNRADVNENVFAASFLLDEAEAFLAVEELDRAFARANDLCRHAVEPAATTAAAGTTPTARAATKAATITTAITATEAVSTASMTIAAAITIAAAKAVTTTIIAEIPGRRKSVAATTKRIETVLAESVALVPAAPTSPIVTHNYVRTLSRCPDLHDAGDEGNESHQTQTGKRLPRPIF